MDAKINFYILSNFIGWIIDHTFFMKWIELILIHIQQTNSIKSNIAIQSNKYIMSKFRNSGIQNFLSFLLSILILFHKKMKK